MGNKKNIKRYWVCFLGEKVEGKKSVLLDKKGFCKKFVLRRVRSN
jgi:hypothetical protein